MLEKTYEWIILVKLKWKYQIEDTLEDTNEGEKKNER
jgi:hypothetical protein